MPETLAESELFGHRKGAFSGADRASPGHLRAADRGTLFLDEIVEMPLPLQAKLLRAIEQREVVPLGESTPVAIDVRFVVAAQTPLREAVAQGRFRGDLLARIEDYTLILPPLRERKEEIAFLFATMISREAGGQSVPKIDSALVEALCLHDWPFNLRELDRLARQMWALRADQPTLLRSHLPDRFGRASQPPPARDSSRPASRTQDPPDLGALVEALRRAGGNVKRAAEALGISRARAYRLMQGAPDVDLDQLREQASD